VEPTKNPPSEVSQVVSEKSTEIERWLSGRPGVGPKHHFGYRIQTDKQGQLLVEVLSRNTGPATNIDRFLGSQNRIDVEDRRIFDELKRAQLAPRQIYIIAASNANKILRLLKSRPLCDAKTQKPIIFAGQLKGVLEAHKTGGQLQFLFYFKHEEQAIEWSNFDHICIFDGYPSMIWVNHKIYYAPARLMPDTVRRLCQFPRIKFDISLLQQCVSRLEYLLTDLDIDPSWLHQRLEQCQITAPECRIYFSFAAPYLYAEAQVVYGPHVFAIDDQSAIPESSWMPAQSEDKWAVRIMRQIETEQQARQIILDAGFKLNQEQRFYIGGDEALDLLKRELAPFVGRFTIFWSKPPQKHLFRSDAIQSKVKIQQSSSNDWFDVNIEFQSGQSPIALDELVTQIDSESRYIKLADGTYAEATPQLKQMIRVMKNLLEERQKNEHGALSFNKIDIGELEALAELADEQEIPQEVQKQLEPFQYFEKIKPLEQPMGFTATLRDYQKDGLSWMTFLYENRIGGILADDMGLGKTVQTLAFLQHIKAEYGQKPSLVVCPTSVVENWCREAHRFVPGWTVHRVDGPHRQQYIDQAQQADLLVTSYGLLRRDLDKLKTIDFRCTILDEAQAIKNPSSQTALSAKKLKSDFRLALTGTPIENRLSELWSIFDYVSPSLFGSLNQFRERYQSAIERYNDNERLQRLKRRVRPFVLRRQKEIVAKELPPKTMAQVFCDVPKATQTLYKQVAEKAKDYINHLLQQKGFERSNISILTELLRLRQIACDPHLLQMPDLPEEALSPKIGPFLELVDEALDSGRKILVFSQFVSMLDILSEELKNKKIEHLMLTGNTKKRQDLVDKFQTEDGPRVFLISLKAGGSGLNLTAADCVIHFDPWWNPAVEEQATDRAHRIGQTKPVFVYELIAKGTVEEKIIKLKDRKKAISEGVLGVDNALAKLLTEDEVMALFDVDDLGFDDE